MVFMHRLDQGERLRFGFVCDEPERHRVDLFRLQPEDAPCRRAGCPGTLHYSEPGTAT